MSFYTLFGYMLGPLNSLMQSNRSIQDALIAADRLFQILDLEQENDHEDMVDISPSDITKIRFDKMSFRYRSGKNLFSDFDFQPEIGKVNGIAGDSGTGKSTLLSLLQGIYTPTEGRILLGDFDIAFIRRKSLCRIVATVTQKTDIFNGTVAENIAISDQPIDLTRVIRVCHETGIMGMIDNLPSGLLTHLGDNGVQLSGGELQKIAIARAVYRDPEIFLFDEPSSAMDMDSETQLKNLILKLKEKRKTILLVSHRRSTLDICDSVIYIKDGKIIQQDPIAQIEFMQTY